MCVSSTSKHLSLLFSSVLFLSLFICLFVYSFIYLFIESEVSHCFEMVKISELWIVLLVFQEWS